MARARLVPVASKLAGRVCSPRLDRRRTLLELALGRCLAARVQRRLERVQLLSLIESHAGAALVCLGLPPAQFEEPIARLQVRGALGALVALAAAAAATAAARTPLLLLLLLLPAGRAARMARSIRTRRRVRRGIDIVALGLFALLACARETQELLGRGGDGGLRRSLRLRARLRRQPLRERERRRLRLPPLVLLLGLRRGRARRLLAILNLGRRLLAHHLAALGLRRLSTSSLRSRRRLGRSRLGLGGRLGRERS